MRLEIHQAWNWFPKVTSNTSFLLPVLFRLGIVLYQMASDFDGFSADCMDAHRWRMNCCRVWMVDTMPARRTFFNSWISSAYKWWPRSLTSMSTVPVLLRSRWILLDLGQSLVTHRSWIFEVLIDVGCSETHGSKPGENWVVDSKTMIPHVVIKLYRMQNLDQ